VLRLRVVLAGRGIASHIYVEVSDPEMAHEPRLFTEYGDEAEASEVLL
jgi:hypothetical protein